MFREDSINRTLSSISKLSDDKALEVANYAEYLVQKSEDEIILKGITELVTSSGTFNFVLEDEDLYDETDIINSPN